jgi:hypothetical protein
VLSQAAFNFDTKIDNPVIVISGLPFQFPLFFWPALLLGCRVLIIRISPHIIEKAKIKYLLDTFSVISSNVHIDALTFVAGARVCKSDCHTDSCSNEFQSLTVAQTDMLESNGLAYTGQCRPQLWYTNRYNISFRKVEFCCICLALKILNPLIALEKGLLEEARASNSSSSWGFAKLGQLEQTSIHKLPND